MRMTLPKRYLSALLSGVFAVAVATPLHARQGIEPLDAVESDRATRLTLDAMSARNMTADGAVTHVLGATVLDPGKYQRKNARHARVFVYDYSANQLIVGRVNLVTNAIMSIDAMTSAQPPLTATESENARAFALRDPDTLAQIEAEYAAITGESLTDPSQLTFHVRGFNPALAGSQPNARSANCAARRCAQVAILVGESILFRFVPIVDLASGQILQRIGHGPSNTHARRLLRRERLNRQRTGGQRQRNSDHGGHSHATGTQP